MSRYSDDEFEYRHVQLPKNMLKVIPRDYMDTSRGTMKLLWEDEWRALGITQVSPDCEASRCFTSLIQFWNVELRLGTLRSA